MKFLSFIFFSLLFCFGCTDSSPSSAHWKIGIDPSWYPLNLGPREVNVTAFSTELLTLIGEKEHLDLTRVTVNWDDLMEGLQNGEYQAILSSMPPYLFNQKKFDFSQVYLPLGPVLVVRENSSINSLSHLENKEIAVLSGSTNNLLLQESKGVLIRYYSSIPDMLNAIVNEDLDGCLIPILAATSFIRDLYQGDLKIATPPLTDEGLRLVAKHTTATSLIEKFNKGLNEMHKNGSYRDLAHKWGLIEIK